MKRLARKLAASIADQGVTSSTNFLLNILLARWLLARDYGAYSVCWSILLVLAAFHNALILEPMTVVGPAEFGNDLKAYFRTNDRLNWMVSGALALLTLPFIFVYKEPVVRSCLLVLVLCVPGYLLLLTARRKQYVFNRPLRAFEFSLIYSMLIIAFLSISRAAGILSAVTGVAAFGTCWFAAPSFAAPWVRSQANPGDPSPRLLMRVHWHYGKWLFASALLAMGASDIQTLLLSMLVDLKSAGALRALMNFVLPLTQLLTVLSIYALPRMSARAKKWGSGDVLVKGLLFPLALAIASALYLGTLLLLAPRIEHLLYAGKMQTYIHWLPLLAASTLAAGIGGSFSTLLRALQNSQHTFFAGLSGSAVGVVCALLLQRQMGIAGALWSLLAANSTTTLVVLATYFWVLRRRHGPPITNQ